jgi:hypothetical protein
MLHGAAGLAQIKDGKWEQRFGLPFLTGRSGDNKRDFEEIDEGIAYERAHKVRWGCRSGICHSANAGSWGAAAMTRWKAKLGNHCPAWVGG